MAPLALQLVEQLRPDAQLGAFVHPLLFGVERLAAVHRQEAGNEGVRFLRGEGEGRHPRLEPEAHFVGFPEEVVEPVGLRALPLGVQVGRTHPGVLDGLVDAAADAVHQVAAAAVVVADEDARLFRDRFGGGEGLDALHGELVAHLAEDIPHHMTAVAFGEAELRHPQFLSRALDLALVVDAGRGDLLLQPGLPGVGDVHIAEVEAGDHLGTPGREIHPDLLGVLEAGEVVAAEAAVTEDEALAGEEQFLLFGHLRQPVGGHGVGEVRPQELAGDRVEFGVVRLRDRPPGEGVVPQTHQESGDVRRLAVGEAQTGHEGLFPVVPRILEPFVEEPGVQFGSGSGQGRPAAAVDARPVVVGLVEQVAALAAEGVHEGLAPGSVTPRRGGVLPAALRFREDILDDGGDLGVVPRPVVGVGVVAQVPEGGHPGRRPEGLGVPDPAGGEVPVGLGGDPLQRRAPPAAVLVAGRVVAAPATGQLVGHPALVQVVRPGDEDLVAVALDAAGFRQVRRIHRAVPVVVFLPAVLLDPVVLLLDGLRGVRRAAEREFQPAPEVAGGAPEVVHRVRGLAAHIGLEVRVGGEGLGGVRVVGVVDPQVATLAAVYPGHLGEVQFAGHIPHEHLPDLDRGVYEVHDGQVAEGVREVVGQGVQFAPGEGDRLGEALLFPGEVGHPRPEVPARGALLGQVVVEGHPDFARLEETRFQRGELLVGDRAAERGAADAGLLVVELVRVVHRLDLALADVGEGAAFVEVGDLRLDRIQRAPLGGEGGLRFPQGALHLVEFGAVDATLRLLHLPGGQVALQLHELALVTLPLPGVVEPDHPAGREQEQHARDGEPHMEPVDVVRVARLHIRQGSVPRRVLGSGIFGRVRC